METFTSSFNADAIDWHHIQQPADETGFVVDYQYAILGYDPPSGRLDMVMRFAPAGGHCERHSHVASTTTLILEGEQHLKEHQGDGTVKDIVRPAGTYALAKLDALPHEERGGAEGCLLLLSLHAPDGILFRAYDAEFEESLDVTIEAFVERYVNR